MSGKELSTNELKTGICLILLFTFTLTNMIVFGIQIHKLKVRVEKLEDTSIRKGRVIFRVDGVGR